MANATDILADLAITRSLILERVRNGLSADIARTYTDIVDDITKAIKIADNINLKNLQITISELKNRVAPDNTKLLSDLSDLAITEAGYVTASTNAVFGIDILSKVVPESTLNNIVKTSLIEGATINEWFSSLDSSMQTDLERQIKLGVSIGETNNELSKRVNNILNKGISHARAITRTAVATVSNQARMAVYEKNDDVIKGYEHLSVLDSRTSFICSTRDGALWDKNGKGLNAKGKENRYQVPPLHFNCRSALVPVTKSFEELGFKDVDAPETTRASIDGQVSSGTTFEKWMDGKSAEFQKQYLGAGRYKLWKDKKISFSDLVNQQGNTLTIQELKEL